MTVLAHIGAMPAEELLGLLGGSAGLWTATRALTARAFRRRRATARH